MQFEHYGKAPSWRWLALFVCGCCAPSGARNPSSGESSAVVALSQPSAEEVGRELQSALLPVEALRTSFQWRQRVTARFGDEERSFEAVLSKVPGELQLLGLGPMGTVGFILRMRQTPDNPESEVEFQNRSPLTFPFDARYILLDVQRVFYPWLPPASDGDSVRSGRTESEEITERWQAGRLQERRFHSLRSSSAPEDAAPREATDAAPQGSDDILISYYDWMPGLEAPSRVVLRNRRRQYELVIETLEQEILTL